MRSPRVSLDQSRSSIRRYEGGQFYHFFTSSECSRPARGSRSASPARDGGSISPHGGIPPAEATQLFRLHEANGRETASIASQRRRSSHPLETVSFCPIMSRLYLASETRGREMRHPGVPLALSESGHRGAKSDGGVSRAAIRAGAAGEEGGMSQSLVSMRAE